MVVDDHPTGLSYKQIATRLVLSHRTVQNHVQNSLGKLQLHNRVELVRYAIEHGLDTPRPDTPRSYS
jgi:DNA-binding NarL/FixJ family response regulator